jgi:hypothetical protein
MGQISTESCIKRASDRILWRSVGSKTIVVNPDSGASYALNAVGAAIWALADGERTIADITSAVCESYEVTPERAQQDIAEWAEWLVNNGLVTVEASEPDKGSPTPAIGT